MDFLVNQNDMLVALTQCDKQVLEEYTEKRIFFSENVKKLHHTKIENHCTRQVSSANYIGLTSSNDMLGL